MYASSPYDDLEAGRGGRPGGFVMDEKIAREVRYGFIRKVYSIISVQLAITFFTSLLFMMNQTMRTWVAVSLDLFREKSSKDKIELLLLLLLLSMHVIDQHTRSQETSADVEAWAER